MSLDSAFVIAMLSWCGYCGWKKYKAATANIDPQVKTAAKKVARSLVWKFLKSRM